MKLASTKYMLVIAFAIIGSIACQDCLTAVKRYWQCNWFYPLMKQYNKTSPYIQDKMVTYELVGEQFTLTQNLSQYTTFSSAMNFFRSIYLKMAKNKCWSKFFIDTLGKYSPMILNKNYFDEAVKIIGDFKSLFAASLTNDPGDAVTAYWKKWGGGEMTSLQSFCLKNDFTSNLYDFYNSSSIFCDIDNDIYNEEYYSCALPTIIDRKKRVVYVVPSKSSAVTLAKCSVYTIRKCNKTVTRFFSLIDWTDKWPQMSISGKPGKLTPFLDSLRENVPTPQFNVSYSYASWSKNSVRVKAFNKTQTAAGLICNSTNGHTDEILHVDRLLVEGTWTESSSLGCELSSVKITTSFDGGKTKEQVFNIKTPDFKQNLTYRKDPSNKNYMYIRFFPDNRTQIYDIQSYGLIGFKANSMYLIYDKSQLSEGDGILIDGFDSEDIIPLSGRKKREVSEDEVSACKTKCNLRRKRWIGTGLEHHEVDSADLAARDNGQDWGMYAADHITDSASCMDECLDD